MGARSDRVHVVPCGVDLDRFHPAPPRRSATRRVVVVSRLVERKGIGNVIEALPAVRRTELVIAGGLPLGSTEHDADRARLRALARSHGVESRVQFLGGIARTEVPNLLRSADVVACCPWYEPFGMVAVEAMACGIPVVATAVGGLAESIVNGRTGLLVPPRRPSAIALALSLLLADRGRRDRMAVQAARRALRYSWRQVAAETYGHLVEVTRAKALVPAGDLGEPA
jgi:glycosyltransferase involved in cell wall biosynthesis